jgi:two-component system sensor histidine kinase HupT/HoxJ
LGVPQWLLKNLSSRPSCKKVISKSATIRRLSSLRSRSDNGSGIVDAALDKMFEPFFSTKAVGEGTGLGLWISWSIAREHGGSIAAANRPEGGALFTVRLPVGG